MQRYDAILFDLLTALIDSWSLWNRVAGSEEAGRAWRAEYLRLTYGCGSYAPYEELVGRAALSTGLSQAHADRLEAEWDHLQPWDDAIPLLRDLAPRYRLGVVTNCSERLGRRAAARMQVPFDCIVTAERAGYYKPDPAPYELALRDLGLPADRVLFVAGSGFDLIGTGRVGLDTLWHNRVGLAAPPGAPAPAAQARTLRPMVDDFLSRQAHRD
ncbi:MAG: HAD-IA family hydrolase [Proteobacteria bacterium]|nr:HAD-IA family hydrolase [Pseudomonadota bacterium]